MFELLSNPWLYVLVGALILVQNIMRALPPPDPAIAKGFGSGSPGYKFMYGVAQGIKGDMAAFGLDPKQLGQRFVKPTNGTGNGKETKDQ